MDTPQGDPAATKPATATHSGRKNPWLAAILALFLGPLGLLYLGWPMALITALNIALFAGTLQLLHLIILPWMPYVLLVLLGLQGWVTATWWNRDAAKDDPTFAIRRSLAGALLLTRGQLPAMGHVYAVAIGFYLPLKLLVAGKLLKGLLAFLICPLLFMLSTFLFFRMISELIAAFAFRCLGIEPEAPCLVSGGSTSGSSIAESGPSESVSSENRRSA